MNILDFTRYQMTGNSSAPVDSSLFEDFIAEYRRIFFDEENFYERLAETVRNAPDKTLENTANLKKTIINLEYAITDNPGQFFKTGTSVNFDDITAILFIGPGRWDGHGIIVNTKPYVFFDLSLFNEIMQNPAHTRSVHILHEIAHAAHYGINPPYYPGNVRTLKDTYFNKMIAEGLATYASQKLTGEIPCNALGFGFMNESQYRQWVKNCRILKNGFEKTLEECLHTGKDNKDLWYNLFFIPDREPDAMTRGRYGYFYGFEIVQEVATSEGDDMLFHLEPEKVNRYIMDYFNLSIC